MNATSNKKYMNLIYHSYKFSIAVCSYDEFSLIFLFESVLIQSIII